MTEDPIEVVVLVFSSKWFVGGVMFSLLGCVTLPGSSYIWEGLWLSTKVNGGGSMG